MACDECSVEIGLTDAAGWPIYYFGAGPRNPELAKVRFCGAICATSHAKAHNIGSFRDVRH